MTTNKNARRRALESNINYRILAFLVAECEKHFTEFPIGDSIHSISLNYAFKSLSEALSAPELNCDIDADALRLAIKVEQDIHDNHMVTPHERVLLKAAQAHLCHIENGGG